MWLCEGAGAREIRIQQVGGSAGLDYVSGTLKRSKKKKKLERAGRLGRVKIFLNSVRVQGIERAYWAPVLMGPYRRQSPAALGASWPWPLNPNLEQT